MLFFLISSLSLHGREITHLSEKEYAQIKGAMWSFRKSLKQLTDEEWELLQRLFTYSPKMKEAYILREELTEIFERKYNRAGAKYALRAWFKRVRQSIYLLLKLGLN